MRIWPRSAERQGKYLNGGGLIKTPFRIGRRELFKASAAGALGLSTAIPLSATALAEKFSGTLSPAARLTVGGKTTINGTLNGTIVSQAITGIVAAGGPRLSCSQVILLSGAA
jgi:hypothetical protein